MYLKCKAIILFTLIFFTVLNATNVQNMNMVGKWPVGECVAVAVQGNYLAVSSGYGIRILDVSDPQHPVHISSIATPGNVSDFYWTGNYLYIGLNGTGGWSPPGTAGLYIVKTEPITAPYRVSFFETSGAVQSVAFKDNVVFLGMLNALKTIDVSNPTSPQPLQEFYVTTPNRLYIQGSRLFAAAQTSGALIYDISNPQSIQQIVAVPIYSSNIYATTDKMFVVGNGLNLIQIYDITTPSTPNVLDTLELPQNETIHAMGGNGLDFFVVSHQDTTPYGHVFFTLRALDMSDPQNPVTNAVYQSETYSFSQARLVVTVNGNLAVAHESGFRLLAFPNPTTIQERFYQNTNIILREIRRQNHYLYVHYSTPWDEIGLSILDMSNPAMPLEMGFCLLSYEQGTNMTHMTVQGDTAYFTHDTEYNNPHTARGITLVDVSDPGTPVEIQTVSTKYAYTAITSDVSRMYLAYLDTVYTLNRSLTSLLSKISLGWGRNVTSFFRMDNHLYVGTHSSVHLLDVSGNLPLELGKSDLNTNHSYNVHGMDVDGNYLYMTCDGDSGFLVLDISNPSQPHRVSEMNYGAATDVQVSGNYAYVSNGYLGVRTVDVGAPSTPDEAGYFQTERGYAIDLAMYNQFICAAYLDVIIFENTFISGTENEIASVPQGYNLGQNYPNPFNPETTIPFTLGKRAPVKLTVYNILGEKVDVLVNRTLPPGNYRVQFHGGTLPSGIYLYELQTGNRRAVRRMLLMK